jgi:hypothetical protein
MSEFESEVLRKLDAILTAVGRRVPNTPGEKVAGVVEGEVQQCDAEPNKFGFYEFRIAGEKYSTKRMEIATAMITAFDNSRKVRIEFNQTSKEKGDRTFVNRYIDRVEVLGGVAVDTAADEEAPF